MAIRFNVPLSVFEAFEIINALQDEKTRLYDYAQLRGNSDAAKVAKRLDKLIEKIHTASKGRKFYGIE